MDQPVKIDGPTVRMGGRDLVLAPLNFRQLRVTLKEAIQNLQAPDVDVRMDSIELIIHGSLSRNYPDMTLDEVRDLIDMQNVWSLVQAILEIAGLKKAQELADEQGDQQGPPLGNTSTGT